MAWQASPWLSCQSAPQSQTPCSSSGRPADEFHTRLACRGTTSARQPAQQLRSAVCAERRSRPCRCLTSWPPAPKSGWFLVLHVARQAACLVPSVSCQAVQSKQGRNLRHARGCSSQPAGLGGGMVTERRRPQAPWHTVPPLQGHRRPPPGPNCATLLAPLFPPHPAKPGVLQSALLSRTAHLWGC